MNRMDKSANFTRPEMKGDKIGSKWRLLCLIFVFSLLSTIFTACMSAEGHLEKGNAYFDSGQLEEAITEYSQAIEIDPEYALAYHHRGMAYVKEGQLELAIADYDKAIDLDIEGAQVYYDRGIAYAKKEQWDLAIADYNEAISLGMENAQVYYNRGVAYEKKEQWDRAVKDYNTCVTIYPNDPCAVEAGNAFFKCHYEWALSLFYDNQYDDAIKKLDIIVYGYPDSQYASKARDTLNKYFLFDSAIKHAAKFQQQRAKYPYATAWLRQEHAAVIDECKAFISKYPRSIFRSSIDEALAECYYQYAFVLLYGNFDDSEESLRNYQIVVTDYPDSIWATCENAKKICEPLMVGWYHVSPKKEAAILLAKACKANVNELLPYLKNSETVVMYYPLLKIGDPTTIEALIAALNRRGYADMAEDYLNCGNDELANAARSWVSNHPDYRIVTVPEERNQPCWGTDSNCSALLNSFFRRHKYYLIPWY
jgi:tetratricopeptide (TPR) repeat protein